MEARSEVAGGVRLHYLVDGRGPAVILLHGYTQTSRMWRPLIPRLAERARVIAPDLPGIGDSDIPDEGADMRSAALLVHELVRSLGVKRASVVGHDIGLMVAYAYAAQFPAEVEKLVLMDAFLPGVEGWRQIYDHPGLWHFRFHGPTPEALVKGRERTYFDHYWNGFAADGDRSVSDEDRAAYTEAYRRPGRMRAGWAYFESFPRTAMQFEDMARTRLAMPLLALGGEKANGAALAEQARAVGSNVTAVVVEGSGHWLMEERPQETMDALLRFL